LPKSEQAALWGSSRTPKGAIPVLYGLAFTVAPHLQIINYRGRFSRIVGI
jgi:hypothetical protein